MERKEERITRKETMICGWIFLFFFLFGGGEGTIIERKCIYVEASFLFLFFLWLL